MAKTKGKPGPKARHESTRDFHLYLPDKPAEDETISLADALERVASSYAEQQKELGIPVYGRGVMAYLEMIIRERSEIKEVLRVSQNS